MMLIGKQEMGAYSDSPSDDENLESCRVIPVLFYCLSSVGPKIFSWTLIQGFYKAFVLMIEF